MAKSKKDYFETYDTKPDYKDVENLKKFVSPYRMKIISREKTRVSARFQRKLSKHIKYARYLALIPYTAHQMYQ